MSYQDLTPGQREWINLINQNFHSQSRSRKDRNMSINTISAGQKDWVDVLNNNFKELSKQSEKEDIVLSDGWVSTSNGQNWVQSLPLNNGTTLKILHLNIHNGAVSANVNFPNAVTVPSDCGVTVGPPVGKEITVTVGGHFQGTADFYGTDYNHIGFSYSPLNGEAGPFDVNIDAMLIYL
jgi:hypothetical protein